MAHLKQSSNILSVGLMEIFFGPPWPKADRLAYANFLREHGFGFYMYGPKADANLRRNWQEEWPPAYIRELCELSQTYRANGVKFGIILSPFGLHEDVTSKSDVILRNKLKILEGIGIDMLGIFFDDMPNSPGLARRQLLVLQSIRAEISVQLVFCPTFYSTDPVLDRVFGQRDPDYLYEIGERVPADTEIIWTGPKVISDSIPDEHLIEVSKTLRRKPFICDNIFANDGPNNCKFIKLKNPVKVSAATKNLTSHWAFNPMNQPELSKIVLLNGKRALDGDLLGENQLAASSGIYTPSFSEWLLAHRGELLFQGLDKLTAIKKQQMLADLRLFSDAAARELTSWLHGGYAVGMECLTD
jgi:hyaluronoglucosaminidase